MPVSPRIALVGDESATLLFQRGLPPPGERCFACPHRHVPSAMSTHSAPTPVLPLPPLHGPRAAPLPAPTRPAPSLPRPALLPAVDPQATLVLPDALKPAGPEAATLERPVGAARPAATGRDGPVRSEPARPAFDELASPDITMMQQVSPARPARPGPRRPARRSSDARAYLVLNLWLGLLIVAGLMVLIGRAAPGGAGPVTPATEDHAKR